MTRTIEERTDPTNCACDSEVAVRYRRGDGRFVDTTLRRLPIDDVVAGLPVREFRAYRGRPHYSGWYWSATTGGHVVYESRLELARILLADQDPDVVGIAAQPFLLQGFDGDRTRRHVPDLLLSHAGGGVSVVDVKSASRMADPAVVAQFAWTKQICEEKGFGFEAWSTADPVYVENVRFLAGYRRGGTIAERLVPVVLDGARSPVGIVELERRLSGVACRDVIRPVILHLVWGSRLTADLSRALDGESTVVAA